MRVKKEVRGEVEKVSNDLKSYVASELAGGMGASHVVGCDAEVCVKSKL